MTVLTTEAPGRVQVSTTVTPLVVRRVESTSAIPPEERWLWDNPDVLTSLDRGLAEMGRGEAVYLGSFAQYATDDIDD